MATKPIKKQLPSLDERAILAGQRVGQRAIVSRGQPGRGGIMKSEVKILGHKTTYGIVHYLVEMVDGGKLWVRETSITFKDDNNSKAA